jgi:hypothetical protein
MNKFLAVLVASTVLLLAYAVKDVRDGNATDAKVRAEIAALNADFAKAPAIEQVAPDANTDSTRRAVAALKFCADHDDCRAPEAHPAYAVPRFAMESSYRGTAGRGMMEP